MSNEVRHFAINADDLPRARRFYERVFGWRFEAWGPPGFFMIATGAREPRVLGSLQQRRELVKGRPTLGYECTIGVEQDVAALAETVKAAGGRILMEKATIAGVGDLIWFEDVADHVKTKKSDHTSTRPESTVAARSRRARTTFGASCPPSAGMTGSAARDVPGSRPLVRFLHFPLSADRGSRGQRGRGHALRPQGRVNSRRRA